MPREIPLNHNKLGFQVHIDIPFIQQKNHVMAQLDQAYFGLNLGAMQECQGKEDTPISPEVTQSARGMQLVLEPAHISGV